MIEDDNFDRTWVTNDSEKILQVYEHCHNVIALTLPGNNHFLKIVGALKLCSRASMLLEK